MPWPVVLHPEFAPELLALASAVRIELLAKARLIEEFGPSLRRPHADTLEGSKHANMKELRFSAGNGEWRVAFAFDPERSAVVLMAGDKSGVSQKRFYRSLIDRADARFDAHLERLKGKWP
jgi:hypothetical protein